jgi:hypothetical protein
MSACSTFPPATSSTSFEQEDAMILLPFHVRQQLLANGEAKGDHVPLVKLFSPIGAATWLGCELSVDNDTLFGLADLGFGCPELGHFSLAEIEALTLPHGLKVERDLYFLTRQPISLWAATARVAGSISAAETIFRSAAFARRAANDLSQLPPRGG